jgi:hypothetical protein
MCGNQVYICDCSYSLHAKRSLGKPLVRAAMCGCCIPISCLLDSPSFLNPLTGLRRGVRFRFQVRGEPNVAGGESGFGFGSVGFGSFPRRSRSGSELLVVIGTVRLGKEAVFVRVFGESCVRSIITTSFVCMGWSIFSMRNLQH